MDCCTPLASGSAVCFAPGLPPNYSCVPRYRRIWLRLLTAPIGTTMTSAGLAGRAAGECACRAFP